MTGKFICSGIDAADCAHCAVRLREAMSEASEMHACAGWLRGTESVLWATVQGESNAWELTAQEIEMLKALSICAGGWWEFEKFLEMDEWVRIYEVAK